MHVRSEYENLVEALTEFSLKCRAFAMLIFNFIGLGHLEEEFVVQTVYMIALTPFALLVIALFIEKRMIDNK